ncbi:hypothetical protein [Lampropedia puyangensis]|uniref:hypothetical protein n=1 Tax=Lampropedia puyangensis TaxID=1330072 RepID=UPI0013053734|nr:hypothetical protein [Lampropedia puyangensis]
MSFDQLRRVDDSVRPEFAQADEEARWWLLYRKREYERLRVTDADAAVDRIA